MKTNLRFGLIAVFFLSTIFFFSCQKTADLKQKDISEDMKTVYTTGISLENGSVIAGGVTLTAPTTVNINDNFSIIAEVTCGRISIERGYILGPGGVHLYKNLTCQSANLLWEELVIFQCYTDDATWNGALTEVGTYVYRTKHNAADGNCDGLGGSNQSGNCSFSGNNFYCFSIEAIDPCTTSFTGEAISCGNARQAVYRFTSVDAQDYIKIQGGLTNFTGGDATITIAGGNLTSSQSTPGGSSNRIITIEGSLAACEDITITITWNSTNSGGTITGSWSVKDENGIDIAPPVPGLTC